MRDWPALFLLAAVLATTGCQSPPPPPLRIAINAWPGYEFLYLAEQKGYFDQQGVAVDIIEFNSLSDARRAYERGQVDGFGCTLIETLLAAATSGRSPRIIYVVDYSNGADVIVANADTPDAKALQGKRVAIEAGTLNAFVLARALSQQGLGLKDSTVVMMPQTRMNAAMTKGDVDAAVTYPPFSLEMLESKDRQIIFDTRRIPGEVIDVLAFDELTVKQRKDDLKKVLRAYEQAVAYSRTQPDDAYRIMAEREGISAAEFKAIVEHDIVILGPPQQAAYFQGGRLHAALQQVNASLVETGELAKPAPIDTLPSPLLD